MQIKHQKNKRVIVITVAVIAALLVGSGVAFALTGGSKTAKNDAKSSSKQESVKKASKSDSQQSDNKKSAQKSDDTSSEIASEVAAANNEGGDSDPTNGGHTPIQYEGQQNTASSNQLSGSINTFNLANDTLTIRVTVGQIIGGNATCNLTLTGPAGQTYTDTAQVVNDPQSASCYGWDIPASKLGQYKGHWKASISITGGDKSGTITGEGDL